MDRRTLWLLYLCCIGHMSNASVDPIKEIKKLQKEIHGGNLDKVEKIEKKSQMLKIAESVSSKIVDPLLPKWKPKKLSAKKSATLAILLIKAFPSDRSIITDSVNELSNLLSATPTEGVTIKDVLKNLKKSIDSPPLNDWIDEFDALESEDKKEK